MRAGRSSEISGSRSSRHTSLLRPLRLGAILTPASPARTGAVERHGLFASLTLFGPSPTDSPIAPPASGSRPRPPVAGVRVVGLLDFVRHARRRRDGRCRQRRTDGQRHAGRRDGRCRPGPRECPRPFCRSRSLPFVPLTPAGRRTPLSERPCARPCPSIHDAERLEHRQSRRRCSAGSYSGQTLQHRSLPQILAQDPRGKRRMLGSQLAREAIALGRPAVDRSDAASRVEGRRKAAEKRRQARLSVRERPARALAPGCAGQRDVMRWRQSESSGRGSAGRALRPQAQARHRPAACRHAG
jgi:hypothetical protein